MLNKKELCQCFIANAQQRYKKQMTDLDVYYASSEVGLALAYLGMVTDQSTLEYIKNKLKSEGSTLFKHSNGRELNCVELLNLLPDEMPIEQAKPKPKENPPIQVESNITEEEIKQKLGERKYYRLLDAFETIQLEDFNFVTHLLKLKFQPTEDQSPAM